MAILPTKLMNATFFPRIFFVIIMGKRDIRKLFVLPSSQNKNNSNYHGKIYQHLLLPFNQKPRRFSLPLKLSPPRVIPVRMLRKEHNVDKREVLQTHATQIQTLQNELESLRAQFTNLKGKSSQRANHAQPVQGSKSHEGPPRSFYGLSSDAMVGEYVLSSAHNSSLTLEFAIFFCPSYSATQEVNVAPKVSTIR